MSNVHAMVARKGNTVLSVGPDASVLDASQIMNENRVGALVVTVSHDGPRKIHGIFTERDVLRRVVAQRRDPAHTTVREVMTERVVVCHAETSVDEARSLVKQRRIRHLPVVDDHDHLVGMISIGDLNAWELDGQEVKIAALEEYLYGQAV